MTSKLVIILGLFVGTTLISGCVPVAVGAVGAVAVDSYSEGQGNDLF